MQFSVMPYLGIMLGVTFGAFNGVLLKWLELPPTVITFFRVAVPTVVLFVFLKLIRRQTILRGNYGILLVASLLNALRMFLYFFAFLYTTVANGVIVLYTWPVFAALFAVFLLKEKVMRREAALMAAAFFGVVVMYMGEELSFSNRDAIGMLAMLVSAAVYALTVIIYKTRIRQYSSHEIIFYQNLAGAFIFLPFVFKHGSLLTTQSSLLAVGHYGILVGIGSFLLLFYALRRLAVVRFSLFAYWEVIAGVLFGVLLLNERLTIHAIVGGILIILSGVFLVGIKKRRSAGMVASPPLHSA